MRTQRDIQRDAADLALQDCIIKIYKDFKELNIIDIIQILGMKIATETNLLRKHYIIKGK